MKPLEYYDEAADELHAALTESAARSARVAAEFRQTVDQVLQDILSGLLTAARYSGTPCREYH